MAKKISFLLILAAFLTFAYATGSAKDVPMDTIESQIVKENQVKKMAKCSDRNLLQFYGLDAEQYESFIYYKGTEALSVEELLIIKAHDKSDLSAVKDAAETRIESQIKTFDGYGPAQVAMLKNAITTTKGNYLFLCVSKHPEELEEVFADVI